MNLIGQNHEAVSINAKSRHLRSDDFVCAVSRGLYWAGMTDLIRAGFFKTNETILFLQTDRTAGAVRGAVC
jgi:hypothetical protein